MEILVLAPFLAGFFLWGLGVLLVVLVALAQWHALTCAQRIRLGIKCSGLVLFLAGTFHGIALLALHVANGGVAALGKVEDGRHYVRNHGRYTEVSQATWERLQTHERFQRRVALPVGTAGMATVFLISLWEKRRASSSITQLIDVERRPTARPFTSTAKAEGRFPLRFTRGNLVGASALMIAAYAAAYSAMVVAGDIFRWFHFMFTLWLVSMVFWGLSWLSSGRGQNAIGLGLRTAAQLGAVLWIAGIVLFLAFLFSSAVQTEWILGLLVGGVCLVGFGFHSVFAFGATQSFSAVGRRFRSNHHFGNA